MLSGVRLKILHSSFYDLLLLVTLIDSGTVCSVLTTGLLKIWKHIVLIPYGFTVLGIINNDKGYQYEEFVNCSHTNRNEPLQALKIIKHSAKALSVIRIATVCITCNYSSKSHPDTHMCKHTHTHLSETWLREEFSSQGAVTLSAPWTWNNLTNPCMAPDAMK